MRSATHRRSRRLSRRSVPAVALLPVVVFAMPAATVIASSPTSADIAQGYAPGPFVRQPFPGTPVVAPASGSQAAAGLRLVRRQGSDASVAGIPDVALLAYQRASAVINGADPTCALPWELLAAIGRVESDDGRAEGNHLNALGVASPGIVGVPLDGRRGVALVADTDAGALDRDRRYDRAVGPMQFLPSTWNDVAIDADGDGVRNPQDVDDAALAAAVYLCAGDGNLASAAGQRAAVLRYNHSADYARLVLAIMREFQSGDFEVGLAQPLVTGFGSAPGHERPHRHSGGGPSTESSLTGQPHQAPQHQAQTPAPSPAPTPDPAPAPAPPLVSTATEAVEQLSEVASCGVETVSSSLTNLTAVVDCLP